ncbi:MAG TPA: ATP-binding protein [Gemmatimonadaceae bacterium]|nr:ATP-binding protein [Gemmatimonadaceae bacterium]
MDGEVESAENLAERLAEAEATLRAVLAGELDAVADPRSDAPVLLHRAQESLRRSEAHYKELVARSPAIVAELSPDGTTLFVNGRITELLGHEASDLIGKKWWESLVAGDQLPRVEAQWQYLVQGNVNAFESSVRAADGAQRRIEWNCAEHHTDEGGLESRIIFGLDVTERRRVEESAQRLAAEQAARVESEKSERRAELLAEASQLLGSSLDFETTITSVAGLVVPVLGDWCAIDIIGSDGAPRRVALWHSDPEKVRWARELRREFPPDLNASRGLANVLRTGKAELHAEMAELHGVMAHNEKHYQLLASLGLSSAIIVPLSIRDRTIGAITLASAESGRQYDESDVRIAEDLAQRIAVAIENARLYREAGTARAEAELARAEAENANQAKSEFLANMSHELRTPLNAIAGYVQLLAEEIQGPVNEKQMDYLRRTRRSQKHLLGLINDVLNFAKLEAGRVDFDISDVSLRLSLAEVDDLTSPQIGAKGLQFDNRACVREITVRADADKLRQILLNLVSNAVKFTPTGGRITVECGIKDSHAFVTVEDTGVGIPSDKVESIFEPFVQVGKGVDREGTGLGLSISRELARAMHGELTAESVVGKGSTFTVTLPLSDPQPEKVEPRLVTQEVAAEA